MAEVNRISSFKSFTEVKTQEATMKLREENNLKRQETVSKIGTILDEMGLTSLSELDEDKKQALISKLFGNVSEDEAEEIEDDINKLGEPKKLEEGNAFVYAASKAKADGKTEFEFNGKKYKVTIKDTGVKESEESIAEGNAFGDAVRKAKEAGEKEFEFEGETYKVEEATITEGAHGMATKILKSIVDGESSKAEGVKMSKELAQHYIDWIRTSPYGKKNGNLPLNMLIDASFNWGIERGADSNLKSELKDLKGSIKESFLVTEGTRGQFGKIDKKGNITTVYTHYDSYPENVLPIIKKSYKNVKAVDDVIAKGDNSGLEADIDKINFYGKNAAPYTGKADKIKNFIKLSKDDAGAEYIYLFDERDNKWYMVDIYGGAELVPAFESFGLFEATVEMDAMDPDDKDFLKFLKKHKVEIIDKRMDGPGGGHPVITMQGKRKDLEAVLADEELGWADADLAEYIEESLVNEGKDSALQDYVEAASQKTFKGGGNGQNLLDSAMELASHIDSYRKGRDTRGYEEDGFYGPLTITAFKKLVDQMSADDIKNNQADKYESLDVNEGAVKQFDADFNDMVKNIKSGYGWIDPEYVADTWENSSDSIDFELVKGEIYKRLIAAKLLAYADDENEESAGQYIKSLKELGIKESVVTEAKDDFMAKHSGTNILLKKGYKNHTEDELQALYFKIGEVVKDNLDVKEVSVVFEAKITEAEIKSDDEFKEYAMTVLKKAFGADFDEAKGEEVANGILKKCDGDYGACVGMLTSSLGESVVVEGFDAKYWEDYHEKSAKITSASKVARAVEDEVEEWNNNNEDGADNEVTNGGEKKVMNLAHDFFKATGWISSDVIQAMIAQES